ncbi:MAG: MerR family transcriptional regulator [Clostridia bacterium]
MGRNISDVAKQFDMTNSSIRYYDKLGLLSGVQRVEGGKRCFTQEDIDRLSVIRCLKNTGMTMADIKDFLDLNGGNEIKEKRQMIVHQKEILEEKVTQLNEFIEQSEFKIWFFDNIVIDGVEPPYSDESFEMWKTQFENYKKSQKKHL